MHQHFLSSSFRFLQANISAEEEPLTALPLCLVDSGS